MGFRSYMKEEWVISIWVMVGVGGKWTRGESESGRREDGKGNGLVAVNVGEGGSLRIGRGDEGIKTSGYDVAYDEIYTSLSGLEERK